MRMSAADRVTAVIFLALGLAMLVGGYTMERLEIRQIHPLSIPGLMPMLLGAALAFCSVILLIQSKPNTDEFAPAMIALGSLSRLGLTVALTLSYALILVGWLPFFWATLSFVTAFNLIFSLDGGATTRDRTMTIAKSILFGGIAAIAIVSLFEKAFLVRLP